MIFASESINNGMHTDCNSVVAMLVQVLKVLEGHTGDVRAVAMSADERKIVSGSGDFTARVWSMETGEVSQILCCLLYHQPSYNN